MCRVLGVSTSGYYAWRRRGPPWHAQENRELLERIREIHTYSRETYGAPRIHAKLRAQGIWVGRKRVARLMRHAGLVGASPRRRKGATKRDLEAESASDLVERDFTAQRPDELWVADITYMPTGEGFLYLAVVVDAFSRRVVEWAMTDRLKTEPVLAALEMAIQKRRPRKVVHHSDHGTQYTSVEFGKRCREAGVTLSMGSVGDCYEGALCESFFATLECELMERRKFEDRDEARREVFEFIEGRYNPRRRHSALGYVSPAEFERRQAREETWKCREEVDREPMSVGSS